MANTSTSGTATGGSAKPTKKEQNLFEEDDEFEEFPAEGKGRKLRKVWGHHTYIPIPPPPPTTHTQSGMYMVRMWVTASSGRTTGMMTVWKMTSPVSSGNRFFY